MKNATAVRMMDNKRIDTSRIGQGMAYSSSQPLDVLDAELNQFLTRLVVSKKFDQRQLLLPGFCAGKTSR